MKALSLVIGFILLAIGMASFIPALNVDGVMFGFMPMTTVMSVLFIITGLAGIAIGMSNRRHIVPPASSGSNDMRNLK